MNAIDAPIVAVINIKTNQQEYLLAARESDLAPEGYYFKAIPYGYKWDGNNIVRDPIFKKIRFTNLEVF